MFDEIAEQHYSRLLDPTGSGSRAQRAFGRLVEMSRPLPRA